MEARRTGLRTGAAALAITAMVATGLAATSSAAAAAAITCDEVATGKDFYPGDPASDTYDTRFTDSHAVPHLDTHVPQGAATWSNWRGDEDLLLITAYVPDSTDNAYVIGIDARTGKRVGTAEVDASHVGGIAVFEKQGWAFLSGSTDGSIRKYPLDRLRQAIEFSSHIAQDGPDQLVYGSSFLTSHGPSDTLWAGKFSPTGREFMHSYTVSDSGDLGYRPGSWEVPTKTQGLVVTEDLFIYSTSLGRPNRSNIYVVRRGPDSADLDTARLHCFRAPTMSEGMAVYGDDVYVVYESGAHYYSKDDEKPENIIGSLHRAPVARLAELAP